VVIKYKSSPKHKISNAPQKLEVVYNGLLLRYPLVVFLTASLIHLDDTVDFGDEPEAGEESNCTC